MAEPIKQEILIVRRYDDEEESHKGGVWKIAHADFMTAMMAFFLVMWLISVADKETRESVANYFNPIQLAESTPDRKGLQDPQGNSPESESQIKKSTGSESDNNEKGGTAPQTQKPRFKEGALFQDPYAVLAKIASELDESSPTVATTDLGFAESNEEGITGGSAYRDPFDPLYWQVAPTGTARTDTPGAPKTITPAPPMATLDAQARVSQVRPKDPIQEEATQQHTYGVAPEQPQNHDGEVSSDKSESQDAVLRRQVTKAIEGIGSPSSSPRVEVARTGEGILISMTDELNFSMFAIGSAEPKPQVVRAMEKIARIISERTGKIIIRGHTDARPFRSEDYDNWRLSTARAHMAYYMLVRGGVSEDRIERVEGYADRMPRNTADPNAAENRRIEILIREQPS